MCTNFDKVKIHPKTGLVVYTPQGGVCGKLTDAKVKEVLAERQTFVCPFCGEEPTITHDQYAVYCFCHECYDGDPIHTVVPFHLFYKRGAQGVYDIHNGVPVKDAIDTWNLWCEDENDRIELERSCPDPLDNPYIP